MVLPRKGFPQQGQGNQQPAANQQPQVVPREGKRLAPITVTNTLGGYRKIEITQLVEKQTVEAAIRAVGWDPAGFEIQLNSMPTTLNSGVKAGDKILMLQQATGNEVLDESRS
jgi:hypothetical protein